MYISSTQTFFLVLLSSQTFFLHLLYSANNLFRSLLIVVVFIINLSIQFSLCPIVLSDM